MYNPIIVEELAKSYKYDREKEVKTIGLLKAVLSWLPRETKVGVWLQSLAFRMVLSRTYTIFADHYPQWVDCSFDEYFVRHIAAPLLARYLQQPTTPPSPDELATLWADQFRTDSPAKKYIAKITPATADFLDWLEAELHQHPIFRSL